VRDFSSVTTSQRLCPGVINFGCFVIVGEKFATMIHRFEKFDRQLQPGLNFKIPIIDKVAYVHDLREQVIEITS
jgi:regulator of protease activity HflC (stomatin/prohibitin superfamily)